MQIICRKKLRIVEYSYTQNNATKEKVAIEARSVTIEPDVRVQMVPDWIKQEDHFRMCVDDGTIEEVAVLSKRKTQTEVPTDAPKPPVTTGWGSEAGRIESWQVIDSMLNIEGE
jgi:hypothetical protein